MCLIIDVLPNQQGFWGLFPYKKAFHYKDQLIWDHCFYWSKPVGIFIQESSRRFKFFFCWANKEGERNKWSFHITTGWCLNCLIHQLQNYLNLVHYLRLPICRSFFRFSCYVRKKKQWSDSNDSKILLRQLGL